MPKVEVLPQSWGKRVYFHCPGCKGGHSFDIRADGVRPSWTFNGDVERPTCSPSLLYPEKTPRCHLFLTDGVLHFLPDCGHELAGQSVPLAEIES